jgi:hypothetical protein
MACDEKFPEGESVCYEDDEIVHEYCATTPEGGRDWDE